MGETALIAGLEFGVLIGIETVFVAPRPFYLSTRSVRALQAAEATWTNTGTVSVIIDALDVLEAVCAVIPLTALFSPLIDILVSGIEAVLAAMTSQTAQVLNLRAKYVANPHHGRVTLNKPHFLQTHQGAYHKQWNDMATNLGLSAAKF